MMLGGAPALLCVPRCPARSPDWLIRLLDIADTSHGEAVQSCASDSETKWLRETGGRRRDGWSVEMRRRSRKKQEEGRRAESEDETKR